MLKKCEICGASFEASTRQKYCSDSCKRLANLQAQRRYAVNHRYDTAIIPPAKVVTVQKVVATNNADYIEKSIIALQNLDKARQEVQDIIDVLKIEQAKYYKEDNDFNHLVEGSGHLSDEQRLKAWDNYANIRSKRRNVKDIIKTLICCIRYTPYNSEKIIKDALQNKIKVDEFFKDFNKQRGV